MISDEFQARGAARAGALSGLCAGLFLTLVMTATSLARDTDVWYGIKGASAPLLGQRAMQPGFDLVPVLLGLGCHLLVSAGWGLLFGLLVDGLGRLATMVAGAAWSFVVWLAMFYVVLPVVGLSSMRLEVSLARAITFHVIYGFALGVAYVVVRRVQSDLTEFGGFGRPRRAL
ncbi:MAG TPA: DUF6789 family protein [Polyangiaceae bacterium]|nr:DUF6789 family protein [Polyangiaceae bacterium]